MKHHIISTELHSAILNDWPKSSHFKPLVVGCITRASNGASEAELLLLIVAIVSSWLIREQEIHPSATGFQQLVFELCLAVTKEISGILE
jgi:hypothetical protein